MTIISPNTPTDPATKKKLNFIEQGFSFLDGNGDLTTDLSAMTDTILLQVDVAATDAGTPPSMYYAAKAVSDDLIRRNAVQRYDNPTDPPSENTCRLAIRVNVKNKLSEPDCSPTSVIGHARSLFMRGTCPRMGGVVTKIPFSVCENKHAVQGNALGCGCWFNDVLLAVRWE